MIVKSLTLVEIYNSMLIFHDRKWQTRRKFEWQKKRGKILEISVEIWYRMTGNEYFFFSPIKNIVSSEFSLCIQLELGKAEILWSLTLMLKSLLFVLWEVKLRLSTCLWYVWIMLCFRNNIHIYILTFWCILLILVYDFASSSSDPAARVLKYMYQNVTYN